MAALQYLLWLTTRPYLRPERAAALLEQFGSAEAAYFADPSEYDLLGLPGGLKKALRDKNLDRTEQILADCDRQGIWLLTCQDAAYPERLLQIGDYPLVLYGRGRQFRFDEELAIGMVGRAQVYPLRAGHGRPPGAGTGPGGRAGGLGHRQGIDTASLRGALQGGGQVRLRAGQRGGRGLSPPRISGSMRMWPPPGR